jgi:hypothetical protein
MRYSKLLLLATAGYGAFALAKPRHLADALEAPGEQAPAIDQMAYTYAGRDLSISALGLLSRNPTLVTAAMVLRILGDLSDAAVLGTAATKPDVRAKVLGVTLGYAAVNAAALAADRRRLRS